MTADSLLAIITRTLTDQTLTPRDRLDITRRLVDIDTSMTNHGVVARNYEEELGGLRAYGNGGTEAEPTQFGR